ncbi:hypothetical protein JAAARDRAFT_553201 [Jaapia argillacea MUCL 33604]|uniref:dual-specificity kinase n=1 Tax=Jaapia argillacea MUCL 33604 TaxID=933084 RepID=A0A067Q321_9AGAM|nr:hypothetical protein JAAARDRAFT_553201 [Jaapia argillacea MUCL 33604]
MQPTSEPITPAKDPANIDRRGLVGVGELATPRWARGPHRSVDDFDESGEGGEGGEPDDEEYDVLVKEDVENDEPDSPWTIEALDDEPEEKEQYAETHLIPRTIRTRPSIADESGGEEILYPRNPHTFDTPKQPQRRGQPDLDTPDQNSPSLGAGLALITSPPSSFATPVHRPRKRTSDEFEMDQSGELVSKHGRSPNGSSRDKTKEDKSSVRRHRSLHVASPPTGSRDRDKGKDRRRESTTLNTSGTPKAAASSSNVAKHARHTSASSSSSSHGESHHGRRVHTTDFSHLPPSPSSSSIQQFLKHSSSREIHGSPNVAHSLLRGTQEGWSGLGDEATVEALRKLDGLSIKTVARTRSSVSMGRPTSLSRPGTPGSGKGGAQWEGINSADGGRDSRRSSSNTRDSLISKDKDKEPSASQRQAIPPGLGPTDTQAEAIDPNGGATGSGEEHHLSSPAPEKVSKRSSIRTSFTPKRGSASSTNYTSTPTTSSRDSASLSAATSATSASVGSGRHSTSKLRRNSAGSDISSVHSGGDITSFRDRAASLASNGEPLEEELVPPVPPLPKDLSGFKSPPQSSTALVFPTLSSEEKAEDKRLRGVQDRQSQSASLEVPHATMPTSSVPEHDHGSRQLGQGYSSSDSAHVPTKTPSKKWSFSNALNIKLSGSPSSPSQGSGAKASNFPVSPRSSTFGQQLRKSLSRDQPLSSTSHPQASVESWSPIQPEAMTSAASLASYSSISSVNIPMSPSTSAPTTAIAQRVSDVPSRSGTPSSNGTNHTTSAPHHAPLSPSSSLRRGSSKRLTPSSIPFFRRSSSQSMQVPPPSNATFLSTSPTMLSDANLSSHGRGKTSASPVKDVMHSTPSTPHKKSSMLSLGLPSLLKGSSSRKSLQDKGESKGGRDGHSAKGSDRERSDKEKHKKDDKDRSESRISVLMGRKRGKTLSSTEPKKAKPVAMPPMQMSALPNNTAQRLAHIKSGSSTSSTSTSNRNSSISSRVTAQTVSSMKKQSDSSLRSRNQLPTIAGSPSVGAGSYQPPRDPKDMPPSSLMNSLSGLPKETPTKIPRIASRSSAAGSPSMKNHSSTLVGQASTMANRRASLNVSGLVPSSADPSPVPDTSSMNEFGVLDDGDNEESKPQASTTNLRISARVSPSLTSRVPRQVSGPMTSTGSNASTTRKSNRESMSFSGLRKSSTASVASLSSVAPSTESHHRFSALSPSKGLKLLSPKISLSTTRTTSSSVPQNIHQTMASPSSSRQSLSTPSPVPSCIDEEELLGDEEMLGYIKRQQAKKLASGASQQELDDLLRFPEPTRPTTPLSPSAVLKSSQVQYLSEYERKEILDFPSVYCFGARSDKKPAIPSNPINNYGYDDDRGDYLVVNRDHLAYRYEVIDTLGKGSFGQVLHCRDHCTGESVAIKIIRNKKRFHHQALVEIKILDNLRKWDSEEKHHVIKMTEHFYFRQHLCIAMELLSINLYELIKANGFVGFTTALIRRFTSQMLLSLSLMRTHRIVHCDLKPENVLLRHPAKSAIKVIDFGSSCFEHEKIYTYIQSRFYRSPEVILGMNYHMAIDMWSLGCILAELSTGFPIFPGENEQEQLSCIMEVLGIPDKDFINRSSRKKLFFDSTGVPRPVVNSKGRRRRPGTKTLAQVLRCDDELFVDFIGKCLVWDPERRMKPQAALRHPFITSGRRSKITSPAPATAKAILTSSTSNLSSSRSKPMETPKKSQISAPTPLTARVSRTTTVVPNTPSANTSAHAALGSSSRSYRASQSQTLSSYHSSRSMNGYALNGSK